MRLTRGFSASAPRSPWLLPLLALPSALAGALVVLFPPAVTLMAGGLAGLALLARPLLGLLLVLVLLYFPLFPNLNFGGLETSITGPLLLVLGAIMLLQRRQVRTAAPLLLPWQKALLAGLALAFGLTLALSQNLSVSLLLAPNLAIYLVILFVLPALIDTKERLVLVAKAILVLAFVLSLWRVELSPLRGIFGLSSLGINGAVFAYHPAVALCLVILVQPSALFSRRWRIFAGLALVSLVLHGIWLQTRAAWLTWLLFLLLLALRLPLRRWARYLPLVLILFGLAGYFYMGTLQANLGQTQQTLNATLEGEDRQMSSDDRIRLLAQQAGLAMFKERPLLGWGPGMYSHLKPEFVVDTSKEARNRGAFNSWLLVLTEMGIVGVFATALAVLLPLLVCWRALSRSGSPQQQEVRWLAFGFALGAFGLAVHLLFIGLMFSFYWLHVGLAWAAVRLAVQAAYAPSMKPA